MQLFYKGVTTLYSDTITDKFYPQDYRKSVKASKNLVSNTVIQFTIHYHQFFSSHQKTKHLSVLPEHFIHHRQIFSGGVSDQNEN